MANNLQHVKQKDRILASDHNTLVDALQSIQGLTTLSNSPKSRTNFQTQSKQPFYTVDRTHDGTQWQVILSPTKIIETCDRDIKTWDIHWGDDVMYDYPTINVPDGANTLYVRIQTDRQGRIDSDNPPTLIFSDETKINQIYSDDQDGDYYIQVVSVNVADGILNWDVSLSGLLHWPLGMYGITGKFSFAVANMSNGSGGNFASLCMDNYVPGDSVTDWPDMPFYDTDNLDNHSFASLIGMVSVTFILDVWLRDGRCVGLHWRLGGS